VITADTTKPQPRRLVRDLSNNRIGEVMAENIKGTRLYLRPVGGGLEWEAPADEVQDVDPMAVAALATAAREAT
jgi:hypothetical protein